MKKNWRTNLGGAITITGTALVGVGVLAQLTQISPASATILSDHQVVVLWYVALVGFIMSAVGKGIGFLFAADSSQVNQIAKQVESNTANIESQSKP